MSFSKIIIGMINKPILVVTNYIFQLILDAQISFIWFILFFHMCNWVQPNKFLYSWGHDKKYIVVHLLTITCWKWNFISRYITIIISKLIMPTLSLYFHIFNPFQMCSIKGQLIMSIVSSLKHFLLWVSLINSIVD